MCRRCSEDALYLERKGVVIEAEYTQECWRCHVSGLWYLFKAVDVRKLKLPRTKSQRAKRWHMGEFGSLADYVSPEEFLEYIQGEGRFEDL